MIRSVFESLLIHSILLALLFVGAAVAGSGNTVKPTLITMSTSIIDTPPPGPVEEPPGVPEPTPPEPIKPPEPPKPKPKKEVKKPEPKPEPVEAAPIPVEKTVEEVAEASENDNSTEMTPHEPIVAAVPMPFNPEGRGGGHGGPRDSRGSLGGGAPSDGIYSMRDLDHRPRSLSNSKPNYPRYARENRVEGTVTVSFILDTKGNVQDPKVIKSDPVNVFESSALTAVRKWKFTPAKKNGELVNVRMIVAVNFSLEN